MPRAKYCHCSKLPLLPLLPLLALCLVLPLLAALPGAAQEARAYVGAQACESCHEEQYASFMKNSHKARSWKSLEKMLPKLTEAEKKECYVCHTTGYGKPGGFVSLRETPEKANLSCETCHGPGSAHAESGDSADIQRKPDLNSCLRCHNAERTQNFNFKLM
ncbi:cytochrome c family protein, partial [Desulfovibrio sp. OttesenSCG-928-A18]|nr:cytochrome c family protein [Desulfovibrio sp. OttesenSCG-928-A18]